MKVTLSFSLYDRPHTLGEYTLYSIDINRHTAPTVGSEVCLMYQFDESEPITSVILKVTRVVYYPYNLVENPLLRVEPDSNMCVQVSLGTYKSIDPKFDELIQVLSKGNQMRLGGYWKATVFKSGKQLKTQPLKTHRND